MSYQDGSLQGSLPSRARFVGDDDTMADGGTSKITRKRDGCFTCRIRKKPCPTRHSQMPWPSAPCDACKRLCIECLGWGETRPAWMMSEDVLAAIRADIRNFLDRYYNCPKPTILSFSRYYASDPGWRAPFPSDEPPLLSWSSGSDHVAAGIQRQTSPNSVRVSYGQAASQPPNLSVPPPSWRGPAIFPLSRPHPPSRNTYADTSFAQPSLQPALANNSGSLQAEIPPQAYIGGNTPATIQYFDEFMLPSDVASNFQFSQNPGVLPALAPLTSDDFDNPYFVVNDNYGQ